MLYNADSTTDILGWSSPWGHRSTVTCFLQCWQQWWVENCTALVQESANWAAVRCLAQKRILRSCKKLSITSPSAWETTQGSDGSSKSRRRLSRAAFPAHSKRFPTAHTFFPFPQHHKRRLFSNNFPKDPRYTKGSPRSGQLGAMPVAAASAAVVIYRKQNNSSKEIETKTQQGW